MPELKLLAQQHTEKNKLDSEIFISRYRNLSNSLFLMKVQKKLSVTFLGGSITKMSGWRQLVCNYLSSTYPEVQFQFNEVAIPSLGSVAHAFRFERDVLSKGKTDLLFLESAVNDSGTPEVTQRRALEGIVRRAAESNKDIEIIMMAFADENKIRQYNEGKVPLEVGVHQDIAKKYKLPFINLAEEVARRIFNEEFSWKEDFKNLHPSPFGHQLYFNSIKQLLEVEYRRPHPSKLVASILPIPADPFNYSHAGYLSVDSAEGLKGFNKESAWHPSDSVPGRPGFIDVPALTGESPGSTFKLSFTGRTVGIGFITGPDAGMIAYSIDGGPEKTADIFIKASRALHLPYYMVLADSLPKGKHNISVKILNTKNPSSKGYACRVAWFLVNK